MPKVGSELEIISHQQLLLAEKGYTKNIKSINHLLSLVEIHFSASDIFFPSFKLHGINSIKKLIY